MFHDIECGLPCTKEKCGSACCFVSIHNAEDGVHICWKHLAEWELEQEKLNGYRGADCD